MESAFKTVQNLISQRLEAEKMQTEHSDEEQFIQMIASRVAELMETNMELFFNHLYRMDVDEKKIRIALDPSTPGKETVYVSIARLIYERQKTRLETKEKFKQDKMDFWGEE